MIEWNLKTIRDRCQEDGECWIWQQALTSRGYPQARINGKGGANVRTFVYTELMERYLPRGFVVASRCNEPRCVSPGCLVQRSRGAVLVDQYKRGSRNPEFEYATRLRNIQVGRPELVKLSLPIARTIRQRLLDGETMAALAKEYGVVEKAIWKIWHNKSWREQSTNASVFTWAHKEAA